jgi:chromosome segregation ATPase
VAPEEASRALPGGDATDVVLTLVEAAWAAGLSRGALQERIRSGELRVRRVMREGRVVSVVRLKELEAVHRRCAREAESARDERAALRERVARLEGELESSTRVERSLQRYADRLEERSEARVRRLESGLAEARRREMTLARALGRAEARIAQLTPGARERTADIEL